MQFDGNVQGLGEFFRCGKTNLTRQELIFGESGSSLSVIIRDQLRAAHTYTCIWASSERKNVGP